MPKIMFHDKTVLRRAASRLFDYLREQFGDEDTECDIVPVYAPCYCAEYRICRVRRTPGRLWGQWKEKQPIVVLRGYLPLHAEVSSEELAQPVADLLQDISREMGVHGEVTITIKEA